MMIEGSGAGAGSGRPKNVFGSGSATLVLRVYIKCTTLLCTGTACRCASCTALPAECQWAGGPYAGTLLLYAQEIAMNRIWTKR